MSAPDTNLATQKRKHRPALRGLWLGLFLALIITAGVAYMMNASVEEAAAASALLLI